MAWAAGEPGGPAFEGMKSGMADEGEDREMVALYYQLKTKALGEKSGHHHDGGIGINKSNQSMGVYESQGLTSHNNEPSDYSQHDSFAGTRMASRPNSNQGIGSLGESNAAQGSNGGHALCGNPIESNAYLNNCVSQLGASDLNQTNHNAGIQNGGSSYGSGSRPSLRSQREMLANQAKLMPRIQGVHFEKKSPAWVANWKENGCKKRIWFRVSEHGMHQAYHCAVAARKTAEGTLPRKDRFVRKERRRQVELDFSDQLKGLPRILGVRFDRFDMAWVASWSERKKERKKMFSIHLYGFDGARQMAIEHREKKVAEAERAKALTREKEANHEYIEFGDTPLDTNIHEKHDSLQIDHAPRNAAVFYDTATQSWVTVWTCNMMTRLRRFFTSKIGFEEAYRMAVQFRNNPTPSLADEIHPMGSEPYSISAAANIPQSYESSFEQSRIPNDNSLWIKPEHGSCNDQFSQQFDSKHLLLPNIDCMFPQSQNDHVIGLPPNQPLINMYDHNSHINHNQLPHRGQNLHPTYGPNSLTRDECRGLIIECLLDLRDIVLPKLALVGQNTTHRPHNLIDYHLRTVKAAATEHELRPYLTLFNECLVRKQLPSGAATETQQSILHTLSLLMTLTQLLAENTDKSDANDQKNTQSDIQQQNYNGANANDTQK